ncbi:MAG: DUF3800 domain-containing protein [Methylobacterium sp.]|nr:DUF3800 domain-containing protein [Methylobacterium sp.]
MYVCYFDEYKPDEKNGINSYIVGGILTELKNVNYLEEKISDIAEQYLGSRDLIIETELHSKDIYFKKSNFKYFEIDKRLEVLERLAQIIGERDKIDLIYSCINVNALYTGTDPAEHAFMHFVERVELALPKDACCILIGDRDDQYTVKMVRKFQKYRTSGTIPPYGIQIRKIVDSVHFSHSHHSRMIQLADAYVFILTAQMGKRTGYPAKKHLEIISKINTFPTRYKEWPKV